MKMATAPLTFHSDDPESYIPDFIIEVMKLATAPLIFCSDDPESHIPNFIIEVVKMATAPLTFCSVLVIEIKNSQHWESGIPALQYQLNQQTDAAFTGTAYSKVYWIGSIGPHWRYGKKDNNDGQNVWPLIDWYEHHS
jgi:hypothetical protein